nr:MAG TPA: hypothetical protein [Caudoviricetes sp.]
MNRTSLRDSRRKKEMNLNLYLVFLPPSIHKKEKRLK